MSEEVNKQENTVEEQGGVEEDNGEEGRMVQLKKVGERSEAKKHDVTSKELTTGKKVLEALEKHKQEQKHEDELYASIKDGDVKPLEGETIEDAKRRMVSEMIEKERRGSVFEDTDSAKEKKIISCMFDVDAAPYDTLFEIQWGMRSNTAAIRETRGYLIDTIFPFMITKEDDSFGVFCHYNTYIYITPGKSAETFDVYLWFGKKASVSKRGICAMLASQLSVCLDFHAKHYFEEEEKESEEFKALFKDIGGIKYSEEGKTDEVLNPVEEPRRKIRLFKINEVCKDLTKVEQVEPSHVSLTAYDGFVFDDGKRIYSFTTKYASMRIKDRAFQFALSLRAQCS